MVKCAEKQNRLARHQLLSLREVMEKKILERKDEAGEKIFVDHPIAAPFRLMYNWCIEGWSAPKMICTMAVRESLANAFGDKSDCFMRNFEKSFGGTLRILRLINESPLNKVRGHLSHFNIQNYGSYLNLPMPLNRGDTISSSSISDCHSSMGLYPIATLKCLSSILMNMFTDPFHSLN